MRAHQTAVTASYSLAVRCEMLLSSHCSGRHRTHALSSAKQRPQTPHRRPPMAIIFECYAPHACERAHITNTLAEPDTPNRLEHVRTHIDTRCQRSGRMTLSLSLSLAVDSAAHHHRIKHGKCAVRDAVISCGPLSLFKRHNREPSTNRCAHCEYARNANCNDR